MRSSILLALALGAIFPFAGAMADSLGSTEAVMAAGTYSFGLYGQDKAEPTETTKESTEVTSFSLGSSSYLLSSENVFGTPEILWPGFLTGMRANTNFHEKFAEPVGNPIYFHGPWIDTNLKLVYIWHDFPTNSQLGGGEANVFAAPVQIALTDRLAFIGFKDGYSDLDTAITPEGDGWNDFGIGLKYAIIVDEANEFILAGGLLWEWHNGDRDVLQGGDGGNDELAPFLTVAKGWDRFHMLGNMNLRIPMDHNDANYVLGWDLHFDYEISPEELPGFFPLFELHGIHYLSDADALPLAVGGLDVTNFGSSEVAGSWMFWGDLGFRWKLTPNMSFGAAYGFPLVNPGTDIFNQRVTVDFILSF